MFLGSYILSNAGAFYLLEHVKIGGGPYRNVSAAKNAMVVMTTVKADLYEMADIFLTLGDESDQDAITGAWAEIKDIREAIDLAFNTLYQTVSHPDVKMTIREARDIWQSYTRVAETELLPLLRTGDSDKATAIIDGILERQYDRFLEHIGVVIQTTQLRIDSLETQVKQTVQQTVKVLAGASALLLLSIGLIMGFLIPSITKPLAEITTVATKVAKGDIDQHVTLQSTNEIGFLAASFRELIAYIKGLAEAADALSHGDLTTDIVAHSDQDVLSKNFMQVTLTLRQVIEETRALIEAAKAGQLDRRGDVTAFQGGYHELVQGINNLLDTVVDPINEAATVLDRVATRDLTARMVGAYQGDFATIKQALNTAVEYLDGGLSQVASGAVQVASASGQINSGSQVLAQGASEQANTLQEVSSSLREMASMSQLNTANAQEARALADSARQSADAGTASMQRLSQAIDEIKGASDETAKIVKTIDEIAFQTNLLALNAAVEAARAGDAGKGFAVVADEVRNLAMRSAEAAKSTAQLINEAVQKSGDGVTLNREVLTNLDNIVAQVHKVSEVMNEIAQASEQQQQGVHQIGSAVEQLNQVTLQTASNAEEAASTAEELSSQATEMQQLVDTFQLNKATAPTGTSQTPNAPRPLSVSPRPVTPETVIPFDDDQELLRDF